MIYFGNDKIKEIYHGSDKIKEVWYGNELVWSGKFDGIVFSANNKMVEWVEGYGHAGGDYGISSSLLHLEAVNNKASSIMTKDVFDISAFSKVKIKAEWKNKTASFLNTVAIRFLREGYTGGGAIPSWNASINTGSLDTTINFSNLDYSGRWEEGFKYRVWVYVFGLNEKKVELDITEIILLK